MPYRFFHTSLGGASSSFRKSNGSVLAPSSTPAPSLPYPEYAKITLTAYRVWRETGQRWDEEDFKDGFSDYRHGDNSRAGHQQTAAYLAGRDAAKAFVAKHGQKLYDNHGNLTESVSDAQRVLRALSD